MESLALLLYENLNITWLPVCVCVCLQMCVCAWVRAFACLCDEQMHSLLFHKAYQGQATERSNKNWTGDTAFILHCDICI